MITLYGKLENVGLCKYYLVQWQVWCRWSGLLIAKVDELNKKGEIAQSELKVLRIWAVYANNLPVVSLLYNSTMVLVFDVKPAFSTGAIQTLWIQKMPWAIMLKVLLRVWQHPKFMQKGNSSKAAP